jgi:hypothetical protein
MDILFYSNYCKHSQNTIQYLAKNGLTNKINCICIDKRQKDPKTNQTVIIMEHGKHIVLPPNINSVPSLLLTNDKYKVLFGEDIIKHYEPKVTANNDEATNNNGEPVAFQLNGTNTGIVSENYTFYKMTPDDLSA